MASYYEEYIKDNEAKTKKMIAERQAANTNISNQYVQDINATIDRAVANSVNKVQNEIDKLPATYQSAFDTNAVQQKINERQMKARMSDLGLTNSGLNRTQQTAINIQRSNADAALRQQMNAATFSLKQQIADLYASGESQKAETAAQAKYNLQKENKSVYDSMMDSLYSNADAYANTRYQAQEDQYNKQITYARSRGFDYDNNGNLVYIGGVSNENVQEILDEARSVFETAKGADAAGTELNKILQNLYVYGYTEAEISAINEMLWASYGNKYASGATVTKILKGANQAIKNSFGK